MKDNFFLDSNIALYLIDEINVSKREIALDLINTVPFISPQVIFECLNVCLRKYKLDKASSLDFINTLLDSLFMQPETEGIILLAIDIFKRYNLQVFDSKIIAAAMVAGCTVLYSEDMQNGLIIDGRLTIVNPFL